MVSPITARIVLNDEPIEQGHKGKLGKVAKWGK
jgi:hypothetical protein